MTRALACLLQILPVLPDKEEDKSLALDEDDKPLAPDKDEDKLLGPVGLLVTAMKICLLPPPLWPTALT